MKNSHLFQLFDSFSKKEIRQFDKFIASPFFNQRSHVKQLFDFLVLCKFEKKAAPNKHQAFQALFPDAPYDDHKLRLSMSLLNKAFEKYLIWIYINEDKIKAKTNLVKAFRNKHLPRHFIKTKQEIKTALTAHNYRNADFFQNQYELYLEEYLFLSEQKRMDDLSLQQVQENLDIAYITSKLRQSCFSLSHQKIYNQEYNFGMLNLVIQYIDQHNLLEIPAISVYYYCYHTLSTPDDHSYFEKFKSLIFKHQSIFPKGELRDLFLLAANYCIRLMNQGDKRFAQEGLSIYKEGLKNEVLLLNGILSRFTYRNIVAKAIVSKDFEWAEGFIQKYKENLVANQKEATYSFNLAWLEYEQKNYDKALTLLNKSNFSDLLLNLSAKTIAMKIYYELNAFDLLYSHLEAMKKFIVRKDIIAYHKKNYLNTIKFTKKLLESPISNRAIRSTIKKEIENTALVAEKTWLLSQVS